MRSRTRKIYWHQDMIEVVELLVENRYSAYAIAKMLFGAVDRHRLNSVYHCCRYHLGMRMRSHRDNTSTAADLLKRETRSGRRPNMRSF